VPLVALLRRGTRFTERTVQGECRVARREAAIQVRSRSWTSRRSAGTNSSTRVRSGVVDTTSRAKSAARSTAQATAQTRISWRGSTAMHAFWPGVLLRAPEGARGKPASKRFQEARGVHSRAPW